MRLTLLAACLIAVAGCSRPSLPEQPADDSSARTTTIFNPSYTPQEIAEKCDVPIYPGAKAPDVMSRTPKKEGSQTRYELVLTTSDAPKKVSDYYVGKLKLLASKGPHGDMTLMGRTPHGNDAIITVASEGGQTVIRIKALGK